MAKSIQILFKNGGVVVEKWIVGGSTRVAKSFTKLNYNCEAHEDLLNTEFSDQGIFCKSCGVKLKLVPEWVVGRQ